MASDTNLTAIRAAAPGDTGEKTVFKILLTISFCHLLNDTLQSLIPAIYPLLKNSFHLDFGQVGLIALTLQLTASILQPLVGLYTDRRPQPYSLAVGMGISLAGLLALALAPSYATVLAAAALMGIGSAVFHPESSRVARVVSVSGFLRDSPAREHRHLDETSQILFTRILHRRPRESRRNAPGACPCHLAHRQNRALSCHPGGSHVFEVFLPGQPDELLHVLSDGQISRVSSERSAPPFHFSRRRRRRHHHRRPRGRQHRPQIRHLGFHTRRFTVHFALALLQSFLDQRPQRHHRPDPGLRLFRHPRLRSGTPARTNRRRLRPILRLRLWHGRHRRGPSWQTRGPHQPQFCLLPLLIPPGHWHPYRLPPQS